MTQGVGDEPAGDSLKGNHRGWFIRGTPPFAKNKTTTSSIIYIYIYYADVYTTYVLYHWMSLWRGPCFAVSKVGNCPL